ncbi:MAG: ATP-binding protein, partial [Acidobacteriaceae bacterium]
LELPRASFSSARRSDPSQPQRWMIRRSTFRQRGVPHTLVVLSDVSAALREEERLAWRRLIRVIGHEISNSLTPIKSIAGSLRSRILPKSTNGSEPATTTSHTSTTTANPSPTPTPQPPAVTVLQRDLQRGLSVIENRAESLNRFVQAYRQLAQLPAPILKRVPLLPLLERVISLEIRLDVRLLAATDVDLLADADQIEQLLINLVRNAVESALTCVEEEPDAASTVIQSEPTPKSTVILSEPTPTTTVILSEGSESLRPLLAQQTIQKLAEGPAFLAGTAANPRGTENPVSEGPRVSPSKAAPPCTPQVTIRALEEADLVAIQIEDNGPGLANPDNLFVPLYTTKKSGSGVGLALARQIVEAHGGAIELRNRPNHQGCIAEVRIPVAERPRL